MNEEPSSDAKKIPCCPNCGKEAKCFGRDIGGVDYYDFFIVWCDACGHVESCGERGGMFGYGDHFNACPYCGAEANWHGSEMPTYVHELLGGFWTEGILRQGKKPTHDAQQGDEPSPA